MQGLYGETEQYSSALDLIGNTPLIKLKHLTSGNIFVKAEFLNLGGSIKDRVAKYVIEQAEQQGHIKPHITTIVEASSGNTGISLALVGRQKGYKVVIVMPEHMSEERKKIIKALGAELILVESYNLELCRDKVRELMGEIENSWEFGQFVNPLNPETHFNFTGPEIWRQTGGKIDAFVAGVGSGGTLTGVGRFLKKKKPEIQIIAVEPRSASAILGREPGLHQIQGIGDGFIPPVLDLNIIDMMITVTDENAITTTRRMAGEEGLLVGTSSGANVWAAMQVANNGKIIATVAPDRAERYFSTALI